MSQKINHNHNNAEDETILNDTAKTLKRAMTVNKFSDMLDCLKAMQLYAKTIEQDMPDYSETMPIDSNTEIHTANFKINDFIQLAEQDLNSCRYILLNDLIEQRNKPNKSQSECAKMKKHKKSLPEKQTDYMKHIIAAQPSALEAIYLEALLNPDQWQYNHHLLQASPMDNLTSSERQRLNEILNDIK